MGRKNLAEIQTKQNPEELPGIANSWNLHFRCLPTPSLLRPALEKLQVQGKIQQGKEIFCATVPVEREELGSE